MRVFLQHGTCEQGDHALLFHGSGLCVGTALVTQAFCTFLVILRDSSPVGHYFESFVAESNEGLLGYTLFFHTFSSEGRGIYMEDLYVRPDYRSQGLGTVLLAQVTQVSVASGFTLQVCHTMCVLQTMSSILLICNDKLSLDLLRSGTPKI